MTLPVTLLLVLLGGAVGALARYLVDGAVARRVDGVLPWGTFTVNVVGSFVLGLVAGLTARRGSPEWLATLVGTGFCGALTTFSTFGYETVRLVLEGSRRAAFVNVTMSLLGSYAACAAGYALAAVGG